jgi:hypothetical protein
MTSLILDSSLPSLARRVLRSVAVSAVITVTACSAGSPSETSSSDISSDGSTCTLDDRDVVVQPGGTLASRPNGSVLRLTFSYQSDRLAIVGVQGVTMMMPPGHGPLEAGVDAGYWVELRDASGRTIDTRVTADPTIVEIPPAKGGDLGSETLPFCSDKIFQILVPNDPSASTIVAFGSPYGSPKPASEIARFGL